MGQDSSEDIDPWAPGGVMSRPQAPNRSHESPVERPPPGGPRTSRLGRAAIAAVVVVASVVVCAALLAQRFASSTGTDDATSLAEGSPAEPSPVLPPVPTTTPLTSISAEPGRSRFPGESPAQPGPARYDVVPIAPALHDIAPTEIVMLHPTEGLHELSLPSGRLRVTELTVTGPRTELAVNDRLAAVWTDGPGGVQVVSTDDVATTLDFGAERASSSPAADRIYLWRTGADDGHSPVALDGFDGGFSTHPARWITSPGRDASMVDFDGALLERDTGGTYASSELGTQRRTTGDVVSTGRNHLLVRECGEERTCRLVSIDREGKVETWPVDVPADARIQEVGGVSPSGDAVIMRADRTSADLPTELRLLSLTDGALGSSPVRWSVSSHVEGSAAWAADGSGVFVGDGRLRFLPRSGGLPILVTEALTDVLPAVATRAPRQSPVCELLALTQPRFDQMRASGSDATGPPPVAVLERIIEIAPVPLAVDADPLVRFIAGFVSAETPDSQRIDNWPAEVRAGLDALDAHLASAC